MGLGLYWDCCFGTVYCIGIGQYCSTVVQTFTVNSCFRATSFVQNLECATSCFLTPHLYNLVIQLEYTNTCKMYL